METNKAGHFFTVTHPNSYPARQDLTSAIGQDLRQDLISYRVRLPKRTIIREDLVLEKQYGCREGTLVLTFILVNFKVITPSKEQKYLFLHFY